MKSLTILGRGPSWKECPFNTEELWGAASCLLIDELKDKNYTKVFAFDDVGLPEIPPVIEIAKERNIPLVSNRPYATEQFPQKEIAREFGSSYFMPTVSYMIAYALYLKYDLLWVFGIDQGPRWDYQVGKDYIMFWLGVAIGRKVDVRIGRCSMRWCYRPGLDGSPEHYFKTLDESFYNHIEEMANV